MAKYDLTGSLETEFTFNIGDQEFIFHKPTVRQMRELSKGFSAIANESDPEKQADLSQDAMNGLYQYITNTTSDRHIADVLDEQPMDVQLGFNEMIQKELGATQ